MKRHQGLNRTQIRMDDALDSVSESKYFATLDLESGFWQVELGEELKALTAFETFDNLYMFQRMFVGLCNAPSTFTRLMSHHVWRGLVWKICLVYKMTHNIRPYVRRVFDQDRGSIR